MATRQGQALGRAALAPSVFALSVWSMFRWPSRSTTLFSAIVWTNPITPACRLVELLLFRNGSLFLEGPFQHFRAGRDRARHHPRRRPHAGDPARSSHLGPRDRAVLVISPLFMMPTVSALVWKNLSCIPVYGLLAEIWRQVGLTPFDWFASAPLLSVAIVVGWQWLPFATLILLTAMQSLDEEQKDAAVIAGRAERSASLARLYRCSPSIATDRRS